MHIIRKLFCFLLFLVGLSGCTGRNSVWQENIGPVGAPASLQYGTFNMGLYGTYDDKTHRVAVLLPTSGQNAEIGKSIRTGIEAAAIRFAPKGLQISFYDTAATDIVQTIESALSGNPELIIGPVFSDNARMLRANKSTRIPALSFTSDTSAVGNGVFSMALMPSNSIEATLQDMYASSNRHFIIIAPNSSSGQIMAGVAKYASNLIGLENVGILYYTERNTDSIKDTAINAALYPERNYTSTRAKEILTAIINNEYLTKTEKHSITKQLDNINRTDTLGKLPYDSILFLGNGDDTKSLVSFLRYYGIDANEIKFYGTSMWQDTSLASDVAMNGAKFSAMPDIPEDFKLVYESATGKSPSRMAVLGYDAMMLAIGALYTNAPKASYLTNPSGYTGATGLFRLHSNGLNERALQIEKLNGDGNTTVVRPAAASFVSQLYLTDGKGIGAAGQKEIASEKINVMDYIKIPERFIKKYSRKNFNESTDSDQAGLIPITILQDNPQDFTITAEDYKPIPLETVSRTYIDSVELTE